jgi:ArsR family transcriptional regulator, virulence genes transcriptional regulator
MKKSNILEKRCEEVADLLKLVAHPNRLKILCCLIDGDKSVSELEEFCGASQSSVSQYLAKMKSEKILSAKRDGKSIRYSLTNKEIKKLIEKMKDIF